MVTLKTEYYCTDCPDFDAETNKQEYYSDDIVVLREITITCKYAKRCAHLMKHLEKIIKNKEKEND